jgi:hypothetical protein
VALLELELLELLDDEDELLDDEDELTELDEQEDELIGSSTWIWNNFPHPDHAPIVAKTCPL